MAVEWDIGSYFRGDTIPTFAVTIKDSVSGDPLIPTSVCVQIRSSSGRLIHSYTPSIDGGTGRVDVGPVSATDTAKFKPDAYKYDLQYTDSGGNVTTYLKGGVVILEDVSRCQ